MERIPRNPKEPARDYALRFLKHNIINLELKPGSMVSASDLADMAGLSKTPVREAMQELEKIGILEILPQAGSRISFINYDVIHESSFIRIALETKVVAMACDCITPEKEAGFVEVIRRQEQCLERGDNDHFLELDHLFHRQLYILTGRMLTNQMLERCLWHFDRLRRISFNAVSIAQFVNDHKDIFEAIRARDKKLAKKLVPRHLTR
ncbi:MAG: GntR family transcriptional regulator, partial [Planctomycetota bacterium]|nr:GntR family transcriptional regulator [Planctomycetota bacterium]